MGIILTLCGLLGALFAAYFFITSIGGFLWGRRYVLPEAEMTARIAAVIPARNEAAVIGALVRSLKEQDYPAELLDVYVVPNNCTDDTEAVALAAGAKVLHVTEPVTRKGDALRQAFTRLSATGRYDAYCVFDADNLVHPGFMRSVNAACRAGYAAAQGFRDSKNPFDSWIAGGTTIFYWFMSRIFNESRARQGLSCHLNGTGFMVTDALVRKLGWDTHTLTEDLEYTGLCALADCRIGWMPEARVYDEQPLRFRDSVVQRRRWTAGSLQCTRRYAAPLIRKHTRWSLDIGCLFLGNLMNYVGLVSAVASVIAYRGLIANHLNVAAALAVGYVAALWVVCMAAAAFMLKREGMLKRESLPTVLLFPLFLASWLPINIYACLTPPPKWRMVRHTRDITLTELAGRRSGEVES
ncbi:MAG: glycosyltransferase family 2 protein [Clostridia bacterium]|nr:glycosyltransferase family 2 protein [Clostridia bacterium]